jgi:hypothetical protein
MREKPRIRDLTLAVVDVLSRVGDCSEVGLLELELSVEEVRFPWRSSPSTSSRLTFSREYGASFVSRISTNLEEAIADNADQRMEKWWGSGVDRDVAIDRS